MNRTDQDKPTIMTFRQALLFVVYYAIFQLILVAIAGLVLHRLVGVDFTWKGLALAFALLACCGPIFALLIHWFRASRDHPRLFAIRFGLSMSAMVILYSYAVTLTARRLGLYFVSPAALRGYLLTAVVVGIPVFSLAAYLVRLRRADH